MKDIMKDGLVSIIMATYNNEIYIAESIRSVVKQSYPEWELWIIDDGSTDQTEKTVKKFTDARIRYIRKGANEGVAAARNRGLMEAKGRYIAFLDSDDIWLPNKLSHQLFFMQKNRYAFTYTQYRRFVQDTGSCGEIVQTKPFVDYQSLLKGNDIGCLTVMLDRKYIKKIHMPKARHEDYVTWLNLLKRGGKAYSLAEDLARYRENHASLTANKWKSMLWTWDVYRHTQQLSIGMSLYYLGFYLFRGLQKHYSS